MRRLIPALALLLVALAASWVGPWPEDELRLAQARQARLLAAMHADLRAAEEQMAEIGEGDVAATVTLAAYHPVASQTDATPWITASGRRSRPGITCAVSWPLRERLGLQWGDLVIIPGRGLRVIEDAMNPRWRDERIDLMEPVGAPVFLEQARVVFVRGPR